MPVVPFPLPGTNVQFLTICTDASGANAQTAQRILEDAGYEGITLIDGSGAAPVRGDVLIDDGIHNLEGGNYRTILFTAPHNRFYDAEANGMIRVHTWEEVVRIIDDMEEPAEEESR